MKQCGERRQITKQYALDYVITQVAYPTKERCSYYESVKNTLAKPDLMTGKACMRK